MKSTCAPKHYLETNLKDTSMKHLQQTNQTTALQQSLETRKKVLTEIGGFSQNKEEEGIIRAQLADSQIKFYDFNKPEHKKVIVSMLLEWSIMLGIKEPMTPELNIVNAKFLIENFDYLTISEIRQAIQWSITGKLDIDPTPYGILAPIYIAKILNKYMDKRDAVMQMLHFRRNEQHGKKQLEIKSHIPYEKAVKDHRKFLTEHMQAMKDKNASDVAGNLVWRFLLRTKAVNPKMLDDESEEYAKERMANLKITRDYRDEIMKLSKTQIELKAEATIERFMQDYVIHKILKNLPPISEYIASPPDDIILPKVKTKK